MIDIDPAPLKVIPPGATLRKRALSGFLSRACAAARLRGTVSVLLTGDERIRALNREFRSQDKATDVLSFPAAPDFASTGLAGDLAVSLETAGRQAAEQGHDLETEIKVLLLHGLLHLAGYDHEIDSGEMAQQEAALRKQLGLPLGLIERGTGSSKARLAQPARSHRPRRSAANTRPAKR